MISWGRALRKMPTRRRRCTYPGGRTTATSSELTRRPMATSPTTSPTVAAPTPKAMAARSATGSGRTNQKMGSAQARTGRATIRSPRKSMAPPVGSVRPAMTLKKVVLPAPFGPMRLTMAPAGTSKSTSRTATSPPNCFVIRRACRIASPATMGLPDDTPAAGGDCDAGDAVTFDSLHRPRSLRPRLPPRAAPRGGGGSGRALPDAAASSARAPGRTGGTGS